MRSRLIVVALTLAACSNEPDKPPAPDPCNTSPVTITQGVYGVVYQECGDLGGPCPGLPAQGVPVDAYVGDAVTGTTTDADGFYQINVAGPIIDLCVGYNGGACIRGIQLEGATRLDYIDPYGRGNSWQQIVCP